MILIPLKLTLAKGKTVQCIEMTGKQLVAVMEPDELNAHQLDSSGVQDDSIVRVNRQGDLEIRRADGWEVIGGLLGDFEHRVTAETKLDWCSPNTLSGE